MRRWRFWRKWLALATAFSLLFGGLVVPGKGAVPALAALSAPELIVTEIHPDAAGADDYEFFEVYNNSNRSIALDEYKFLYRYTDGSNSDAAFEFDPVTLEPQGTHVFWRNNKSFALSSFNTKHNVTLTDDEVTELIGFGGFANGGNRAVVIQNRAGQEIASASYLGTDVGAGLGIHYKWSGTSIEEEKYASKTAATPGTMAAAQTPDAVYIFPEADNAAPTIDHTPITQAGYEHDISVTVEVYNPPYTVSGVTYDDPLGATLYFKTPGIPSFGSAPMSTEDDGETFIGTIPKESLLFDTIQYYLEVKDLDNTATTPTYTIDITLPEVEPNALPPFLVTEIVPDSSNIDGADGYEFFEIYNNTDRAIDFKDYQIEYRYTDAGPAGDVIWPAEVEDIVIPSGETLVFWVMNGKNNHATVADFNSHYGVALVDNTDIVRVFTAGMANGGKRGIVVSTKTGQDLVAAAYNNDDETKADKGIFYRYPLFDKQTMVMYSAGIENATPGAVDALQLPEAPAVVPADAVPPSVTDLTGATEWNQNADLELVADAGDNVSVKRLSLFYKISGQAAFTERYMLENFDTTFYHYTLYSPEMIGKSYVDYYYQVSDGQQVTTSDTYRVNLTGGLEAAELRLNAKDGDIVAKDVIVKGTSDMDEPELLKLLIDGEEIEAGTYRAMEGDPLFAYETKGVNFYFKNAVTIGEEILHTFDDTIVNYQTLSVPIDANRFVVGDNVVSIRAGSKASPFDEREEENKDDFEVRNVRLVLADGTTVYDPAYSNPEAEIKMGDSAGRNEFVDFALPLNASHVRSKAYVWNTLEAADGEHTVTVIDSAQRERTATVIVDNTAPVVELTIGDGATLQGAFTIDAEVSDALAGVAKVEATLDGVAIALPYATSSAQLEAGEHIVVVTAEDRAGNVSAKTVTFTTPEEHPHAPELVAPKLGAKGLGRNAMLSVQVSDPTGDTMDVSFFRGYKHTAEEAASFAAFQGAADREPPLVRVPAGEQAFTDAEYEAIATDDGNYVTTDAVTQFPYQRFEVKLDASVKGTDRVDIVWKGASLEGRKVSLYAWSPSSEEWIGLTHQVAGAEDFSLTAAVTAGDYLLADDTIQVLVQDEIPPTQEEYDYSFVWMSDTQYYSESYPYIYSDIVDWIAEKKDEMKIEYVVHTGDLVDEADKPEQWEVASTNMKVLEDANVPYGVLAGNHDVSGKEGAYDYYWEHFGEERFKSQPTFGGSYDNNRGHYDLVSSHGNDYIFVYMGWGIGEEEIEWMNEVIAAHPDRMAILNFHEYLLVSGNRSPVAENIYQKVVLPNPNVIAALSGHYHDAELLTDEIDDDGDGVVDRKVYQMLADYQGGEEGGQGYIRLMQFDIDNNKLHMKTYSPYLDDYNYYDPIEFPNKDEFSLELDLQPKTKRVATDSIELKVYTDQAIGQSENVSSGSAATTVWRNLGANAKQQWYAVAEDANGGRTWSDVWHFFTGDVTEDSDDDDSGSGTVQPQPQQPQSDEQPRLEVNREQLTGSSGDDEVVIALSAEGNAGELTIPGDAASILNGKKLSIQLKDVTIQVPSSVLEALSDATGNIVFSVQSVSSEERNRLAGDASQSTGARIEAAGDVYEFSLVATSGDAVRSLERFDQPITLSFRIAPDAETELLGVYYISDDGTLEYVGGTLEGGVMVADVYHFSKYAVLEYDKTYADVSVAHWAYEAVRELSAKHVVEGVTDTEFRPQQSVTRAEFTALLVRLLGIQAVSLASSADAFSDVAAGAWFADEVSAALEAGIVQGAEDGRFAPGRVITRQEMITMLMRAIDGREISSGVAVAAPFADGDAAAEWARAHIERARTLGIVEGRGHGTFLPEAASTRAEAAKLIHTLLTRLQ
ncbi:S-layer homology domain-containing protein [Paenibacillus sp. TRM 82003]|nr:S-layer homology domain-containing protein [Paenibacillus sp. TRM 82003]